MSIPMIASACARACSASAAILIPPALPRPPIRTWALIGEGDAAPLGGGSRLVHGRSDLAAGHGDPVRGEELLALILEKVHGRARRLARRQPIRDRERAASRQRLGIRCRARMALPSLKSI